MPPVQKVDLHKADERWVRPQTTQVAMTEDDQLSVDLYRKFQGILNKLTPQKFQKLAELALELAINTRERLQVCIDKIFTKVSSFSLHLCILSLTKYECTDVNPGSQYDAGAYVASVASSLVHNMTLELT